MTVATNRKVYLRNDVQTEPLINGWYAWILLVPPVTGSLNLLERYLPIMKSYIGSPLMHAAAVKNPSMRGGPFIDLGGKRIDEVRELLQETNERSASLLDFARGLKQLWVMLSEKATGMALEHLYDEIPEILKGYVELCYDLNHSPSFRVIEPLLYRSPYFCEQIQSLSLTRITPDRARPFIMSTPRLRDEQSARLKIPFASPALDSLFRMKREPRAYAQIADELGVDEATESLFGTFFTEDAPRPAPVFTQESVRIRYYGHACLLIETKNLSILIDPLISYSYDSDIPRFTYEDLPEVIDYVLITHSHHDHIVVETLLQLRHKVGTVVVGRNCDGFPHDPSLQLALKHMGFANVLEVRDMQEIPLPSGSILSIPFLGEHHDLNMQSKSGYLIRLGGRSLLCIADSCNLDPRLYEHIFALTGGADLLFLGMECDGAPPSWIYGALFPKSLPREIDRSRRARGCNFGEAAALIDRFRFSQVYVYAMGQEPWLSHILDNKLTEESNSYIQSRKLIEHCKALGIHAENLFGQKEITLAQS